MFRKFVLPALQYEAYYLDQAVFHLDGPDALKHLDDILVIDGIGVIQWVSGAGNKPMIEWDEVFQRVHRANKATIIYGSIEEIKNIHGKYPLNLVVYETWVNSEQQGYEFLEWLKKNS